MPDDEPAQSQAVSSRDETVGEMPGEDIADFDQASSTPDISADTFAVSDGFEAAEDFSLDGALGPTGAQIVDEAGWDQGVFDNNEGAAEDVEHAAHRRAWRAFRLGSEGRKSRQPTPFDKIKPAITGALLSLIVAGFMYRDEVVHAVPAMASLFELAGLEVNLRGLDFADIRSRQEIENGVPVLRIEGQVVNVTDETVPVPVLRFALTGGQLEELYSWTIVPERGNLEAGETLDFATRLAAPPEAAEDLVVMFIDDQALLSGLN